MKKSKLELSPSDQEWLSTFTNTGRALARELKHANALLLLAKGLDFEQIGQQVGLSSRTIRRIEARFLSEGLEAAVKDKARSGAPPKLDGGAKALVIATTCSEAPKGHDHWTLRMISRRLVELGIVENISPETVRSVLKKTN